MLLLCAALAARTADAQTPAAPLPDGRYAVSRALVEDYVACAVEARALHAVSGDVDIALDALSAELAARGSEVELLRDAIEAGDLALRICEGRRRTSSASAALAGEALDALTARAQRAERSRGRWRALALAGPVAVGAAGVVVGVLLSR